MQRQHTEQEVAIAALGGQGGKGARHQRGGRAEIGGHAIRAGTSILMPIYAIHRHARRWERADEFDPARFAPQSEAAIPRYQYMPFGAGPRICIGMSFAMIEATAILATLLRHARFAAVPGHEPTPIARVTLIPSGGMPLAVNAADHSATARELAAELLGEEPPEPEAARQLEVGVGRAAADLAERTVG